MVNKEQIKQFFLEEYNTFQSSGKIDRQSTPILFKLGYEMDSITLEKYIKNLKNWVDNDIEIGFVFLEKMFYYKEVEVYRIEYKDQIFKSKDYTSTMKWMKDFLENSKIPFSTLSKLNLESPTFAFNILDLGIKTNPTELKLNRKSLYFQHRHWGLDKMNKKVDNPNRREGDGKLKEKLNLLSELLNDNIMLKSDGFKVIKSLGKHEIKEFYENSNS